MICSNKSEQQSSFKSLLHTTWRHKNATFVSIQNNDNTSVDSSLFWTVVAGSDLTETPAVKPVAVDLRNVAYASLNVNSVFIPLGIGGWVGMGADARENRNGNVEWKWPVAIIRCVWRHVFTEVYTLTDIFILFRVDLDYEASEKHLIIPTMYSFSAEKNAPSLRYLRRNI